MTKPDNTGNGHPTPTEVVVRRMRALRDSRGWSARALAERIAALGNENFDRYVIANLENGRRRVVSVDELMVLAAALNVAPVHLMIPPDDDEAMIALTPEVQVPAYYARRWITGQQSIDMPLPDHVAEHYYIEQDAETKALRNFPALGTVAARLKDMVDLVLRRFATPEHRDSLISKLQGVGQRIDQEFADEISGLRAEIAEEERRALGDLPDEQPVIPGKILELRKDNGKGAGDE